MARSIGILFYILSLQGDNTSNYSKLKSQAKLINNSFAQGKFADLPAYVEYYNRYNRKVRDEIIFRYIASAEMSSVGEDGSLPNKDKGGQTVEKFVTPDLYLYSGRAKQQLALRTAPDFVIYTFRSLIQETLNPQTGWRRVVGANNEPGGGREGTIFQPFPIMGAFMLRKE
jgi:hypothetical protein